MTHHEIGRAHRMLRTRAGLRQSDVAASAGVGRWKVVGLEAGELGDLFVRDLIACFDVLGARVDIDPRWRGAGLDRLLDEIHARLVGHVLRLLRQLGWLAEVEVSFGIYGDRGSIDVLAFHEAERALAVIEVKSELGAVEGLLRPVDTKVRHARDIARDRFGWDAATVSKIVVLPEDRTARRGVDRHSAVFGQALPARSRDVRRWLRKPEGRLAGLWFLTDDGDTDVKRNPSSIRRVRPRPPRCLSAIPGARKDDRRLIDPHNVGEADI